MTTILLDVDGPLADNIGATLAWGNQCFGTSFTAEDADQWDFFEKLWPKATHVREIRRRWESPIFWEDLPITAGAEAAVARLRQDGHRLVFVTSPYERCVGWESARRWWLQTFFGAHYHDIVFTHCKELVHGDCLIDDKPLHVNNWAGRWCAEAGKQAPLPVLFNMPHNQRVALHNNILRGTWSNLDYICQRLREEARG